eukprot:951956-Alexandrium_andersonii.AAC.1
MHGVPCIPKVAFGEKVAPFPVRVQPSELHTWVEPAVEAMMALEPHPELVDLLRGEGATVDVIQRTLQGAEIHEALPAIEAVRGVPPDEPNIFIDGSVVPSACPPRARL